jgi:release factor glutamine methyltransferase
VQDAAPLLKSGGVLAFEIGYDQGAKVKNIMEESGYYADVRIEKDLSGLDRCIWGYRKH